MKRSHIEIFFLGIIVAVLATRASLTLWPQEQPAEKNEPQLLYPLFEKRYPIAFHEYLELHCQAFLTVGDLLTVGDRPRQSYMYPIVTSGKEGREVIIVIGYPTNATPSEISTAKATFDIRIKNFKELAEKWREMGYDIPEDRIHVTTDALKEYGRIKGLD